MKQILDVFLIANYAINSRLKESSRGAICKLHIEKICMITLIGVLYGNGTFGNKEDKISSHGKISTKVRRNAGNRNDGN